MSKPMRCPLVLAAAATLAGAGTLHAQRFEGAVTGEHLTYRLRGDAGGVQQSGMMLGAGGSALLGPVRLALRGQTGSLGAVEGVFAARSLRITTLNAGVQLAPWLEAGIEAEARREAVDTSVVLQRFGGAYGRIVTNLGAAGLQGTASLAFFPATSSTNTDPVGVAARAGVGLRYAPANSPVVLQLGYRFFRIDPKAATTAVPRLEQDEGLVFGIGIQR